jgi:hypothetical protein
MTAAQIFVLIWTVTCQIQKLEQGLHMFVQQAEALGEYHLATLARAYVEPGLSNATATLSEVVKEIRNGLGDQESITILASIRRHLDDINSEFVTSVKKIKEHNEQGDPYFTSAMDTLLSNLTRDGVLDILATTHSQSFTYSSPFLLLRLERTLLHIDI